MKDVEPERVAGFPEPRDQSEVTVLPTPSAAFGRRPQSVEPDERPKGCVRQPAPPAEEPVDRNGRVERAENRDAGAADRRRAVEPEEDGALNRCGRPSSRAAAVTRRSAGR